MGKEIVYEQNNPTHGKIQGKMRIIGRHIYFPNINSPQIVQVVGQLSQKGAEVIHTRKWIRVDMFKNQTKVKLGGEEFDASTISEEEIEEKLSNFYVEQYKKANFVVQMKELN